MYSLTIARINKPNKIEYTIESPDLDVVKKWTRFMIPALDFDSLKLGTKKEVDGVYVVRFKKEEDLADSEEDTDLSDQSVASSLKAIADTNDLDSLIEMLTSEKTGKKRKTVIAALEKKLS